jgi:predicted nuclease of predicted toxin-antitoxin system
MPPSSAPKLHLNENLSPRFAEQLRRQGFDVTSTQEAEMLAASDEEQLAHACAEQRAILTFNVGDFVALHHQYIASGKEHWGIVLSSREAIGVLLQRILRLLNSVAAEELKNQFRWLNEFD